MALMMVRYSDIFEAVNTYLFCITDFNKFYIILTIELYLNNVVIITATAYLLMVIIR